MAVLTIPLQYGRYGAPDVVEIPLEDPVATYRPQVARLKREPLEQKGNRIAPGHEGSRRRRRYEMQNLLGCAQRVEPTEEDWSLMPIQTRTISWERLAALDGQTPSVSTRPTLAPKGHTLPRAIRQEIKRVHVCPSFVHGIEKEVRDMIDPSTAEPEYEVVDTEEMTKPSSSRVTRKRSVHISIDAPTEKARSYSRWWIHLISKYYNLKSYSEDFHNRRVACIDVDGRKLPSVWFCDLL